MGARTTIVKLAVADCRSVPKLAKTVPADELHEMEQDWKVAFTGRTSVIVKLSALAKPTFCTVIAYVSVLPLAAGLELDVFAMIKSGNFT